MSLLDLLLQFLSRFSFGLSLVMALGIPARIVPAGFFRGHSHVLLGVNVLASLIAFNQPGDRFWYLSLAAAIASYVGSVAWLYENPGIGKGALLIVSACSLIHAGYSAGPSGAAFPNGVWPIVVAVSSGLSLGAMIGAMFLGHYYLNAPAMRLEPLRALVVGIFLAVVLRGLISATGAGEVWAARESLVGLDWALVAMHVLAALAGPLVLAWMAWQTLKIPNTQSATGILYVGVIFVFLGELAALVLSGKLGHPI